MVDDGDVIWSVVGLYAAELSFDLIGKCVHLLNIA